MSLEKQINIDVILKASVLALTIRGVEPGPAPAPVAPALGLCLKPKGVRRVSRSVSEAAPAPPSFTAPRLMTYLCVRELVPHVVL